MGVGKDDIGFQ